ncbi:MAG: IclR family transcriptional regulator, partial [Rhizobiales bacterium]|nr:IclR family transcriptional regulator [Hyphomicrobiales bacterium]
MSTAQEHGVLDDTMLVAHSRYHITALARGLTMLDVLSRRRFGLTVTEVADETGWSITTAFRVASTLCQLGYLNHDKRSGLYELAYSCLLLGYCAIFNLEISEIALPDLQRLHRETTQSVLLSVLAGAEIVSTVRLLRSERFGAIGDRFPAHATPNGKMLIAHLPLADRERLLASEKWAAYTPKTITDPARLRAAVEQARRNGFSVTDDELVVGTRGVAAPIFDSNGTCVAAVSIVSAGNKISLAALLDLYCAKVCETAKRISVQL